MEIGINLEYVRKRPAGEKRTVQEAARLCREIDFTHLDYTGQYREADWERRAHEDRAVLDALNLPVEQSHAPYNRYGSYAPDDFLEYLDRSFRSAAILGAKYMVIHADEYIPLDHWDPKEIAEKMYELYAPYVDFAKKQGLCVAVENLFDDHARPDVEGRSRFTDRVEEVLMMIGRFHDPSVVCCWDFGHGNCAYGKKHVAEALRMAAPHVRCTHVHDNYYGKDLHLMPFLGELDWAEHMRILKETGYPGRLTYEFVYGQIPDAIFPDALSLAHQAGQKLCAMLQ